MPHLPCTFDYSKPIIQSLEVTLSPGRLHLYREISPSNDQEALKLYCWNTSLSQVLYWPLHAFEISLRNAMADSLFEKHGEEWFENIDNFRRRRGANEEVEHVEKAKHKLERSGLDLGHDNIVAAISMGFWEGLLKAEYEQELWRPLFSNIFPIGRNEAFKKVNQIKRLRNSVAHHEPVFVHVSRRADKRLLYKDYKLIMKLIRWICNDTAQWIEFHVSQDFFSTWNGAPDCIAMPKITVADATNEGNSLFWQFTE